MSFIGILGIFVALFLLIYLTYKGYSVIYGAIICALIVAFTSGIFNIAEVSTLFITGFTNFCTNNGLILICGAIFGQVYVASGASEGVARAITGLIHRCGAKAGAQVAATILLCILLNIALNLGGVPGMAGTLVTYGICIGLLRGSNIPRRYIIAFMMICPASSVIPTSPQIYNVIPMALLGTTSTAAAIPGLIGGLVQTIAGGLYLYFSIRRAQKRGEVYVTDKAHDPDFDADKKVPNFFLSLLQLIVVFVIFNITQNVTIGTFTASVLCCLMFYPRFGSLKAIQENLNKGGATAAALVFDCACVTGFGYLVQNTSLFGSLITNVASWNINPLVITAIVVALVCAITAAPNSGLNIGIPILQNIFGSNLGTTISASAVHRVASFAANTFETVPTNGGILLSLRLSGLTHKEAYFPVFVVTVLCPMLGCATVIALLTLFPGLA